MSRRRHLGCDAGALAPWTRIDANSFHRVGWWITRSTPPFRGGWLVTKGCGAWLKNRNGRVRLFSSPFTAAAAANKGIAP